ncbi:DOB protein, partial [Vireo altiloquus]|nr:DOB protein [Vireo altiloquus]
PPDLCPAHTEVFQEMYKFECYYINGTKKVRLLLKNLYNRELYMMFDSDMGHFVGFTPDGEIQPRYWNSLPNRIEYLRFAVDRVRRHNYELYAPFLVEC